MTSHCSLPRTLVVALSLVACATAFAAIPVSPLPVAELPNGSVSIDELLPNEIPGMVTEWVTIAGPSRYVEQTSQREERVWLALQGTGTFVSAGKTFVVDGECIARAPLGETWQVEVAAGNTLRCVRFRKVLSEEDRAEYAKFPENQQAAYFRRFVDCTPYGEAIKSAKTTSRTLLPQNIVPRLAIGTVETLGPDEVKRHKHPMLEQYFVGLQSNRCTVAADNDSALLPPLSVMHIPLGSMHGARVKAGDKLYYVWVDCFTTREGQEWLKTHKPIEETAPASKM